MKKVGEGWWQGGVRANLCDRPGLDWAILDHVQQDLFAGLADILAFGGCRRVPPPKGALAFDTLTIMDAFKFEKSCGSSQLRSGPSGFVRVCSSIATPSRFPADEQVMQSRT